MADESQPLLLQRLSTRETAATTTTTTTTEDSNDRNDSNHSDNNNKNNDNDNKNSDNDNNNDDTNNPWSDAMDTLVLSVPIFVAMVSWVGMKLTDSALLGHVHDDDNNGAALAAASLSDLYTMCTAVLLQGRVLSVLVGAALGGNNPTLAGVYLQVSLVVLAGLAVLVMMAWWCTGMVWKIILGSTTTTTTTTEQEQPPQQEQPDVADVADMAGYYATVLSASIPAQVVLGQVSQFFSSQRILHPEVHASVVALLLNLLLGLVLVLGVPIPGFDGLGFIACPIVTTAVTYAQVAILVGIYCGYFQLHKPCWAGWHVRQWTWHRITTFLHLYIPAAMGMASDFWRVAVVGMAAARLGNTEVAVFNTSYRIMWVVLIAISALSSAAGIKLTLRLGRNQARLARQAGLIGIAMAAAVLTVLGLLVYTDLETLGRIFTNDPEFLDLLTEAALPFTLTLVLMNFSVALERLPYAMGRTKEVFWYGFVASWGFQVPAVYALTIYWRDDLTGLYTGMAVGYTALAILYGWIVATSDWDYYAKLAIERAEIGNPPVKLDDEEKI